MFKAMSIVKLPCKNDSWAKSFTATFNEVLQDIPTDNAWVLVKTKAEFIFQCLDQRCPTLWPFATCGDKRFKCGVRQFHRNVYLLINKQSFSQLTTKVATGRFGWTMLV